MADEAHPDITGSISRQAASMPSLRANSDASPFYKILGIIQAALTIMQGSGERRPRLRVEIRAMLFDVVPQLLPELVVTPLPPCEFNDPQIARKTFFPEVVVQGRYQFATGHRSPDAPKKIVVVDLSLFMSIASIVVHSSW